MQHVWNLSLSLSLSLLRACARMYTRTHTHTQGYNLAKITKDSPSTNPHDRTYKSKLHIWSLSFKPYFNLISNFNLVSKLIVLYKFSSYHYFLDENC